MKYKVITHHLRYFDRGDILEKNKLGSYSKSDQGIVLTEEEVENNPHWFKEINEDRWQIDKYGDDFFIFNSELSVLIDEPLNKNQANRIIYALNKLGV